MRMDQVPTPLSHVNRSTHMSETLGTSLRTWSVNMWTPAISGNSSKLHT